MRIGYLYDFQAYPPKGGNHVHAMELTQGFLRHGHSVSVVDDPTMPGVSNYTSDSESLAQFVNSIDVLYVRIDARFIGAWTTLAKCIEQKGQRPVVWEINSPANEALAYSWLGGLSTGNEGIVRRLKRWFHASRKVPGIKREEQFRHNMASHVDAAICVSKSLARYATDQLGIESTLVMPNGGPLLSEAEVARRSKRRQWPSFAVLYSGSAMYPWQGLNYLEEVIALAQTEAPDITFVLAVNQRPQSLPTSDNVVVLERLNREEILDAICSVDACVSLHPEYPWSEYNFHNSPMKLFEYMACMRPIVASNHGQMKDIIHDGKDGLLCRNDPRDILDKLIYLKENTTAAATIGRKGWDRIQSEFSWENNIQTTLKLFQSLVSDTPS